VSDERPASIRKEPSMINPLNGFAATIAGSPVTEEPDVVRYYCGFRLVLLPNATTPVSRPCMGIIEPVTDTAIAILDGKSSKARLNYPQCRGDCRRRAKYSAALRCGYG
jgi:hypothetical protein